MNQQMLAHDLASGTKSWDVTIWNILALALQSATGARGGDLVRSTGYTGREYLAWKDVTLELQEDDTFVMIVKLRYCKGAK